MNWKWKFTAILFSTLALFASGASAAPQVYYNARVFTSDTSKPEATAFVVDDGKFIYVGDDVGAKKFGAGTDLRGKRVIPGMIESHAHLMIMAALDGLNVITIPPTATREQASAIIKEKANDAEHKDLEFIVAHGIDPTLRNLLAAELDKAVSDRPTIVFTADYHAGWLNTKALEMTGVTKDVPDPMPGNSYFERDKDGAPTGYIVETPALYPTMQKIKLCDPEKTQEALVPLLKEYARMGFTGFVDAGFLMLDEESALRLLQNLEKQNKLTMRYFTSYAYWGPVMDSIENMTKTMLRLRGEYSSPLIHPVIFKVFIDGTLEVRTALMEEDYSVPEGGRGVSLMSVEDIIPAAKAAAAEGFNIHLHGIGDKAISNALTVYESLGKISGTKTVAHNQIMPADGVERYIKQGDVFFQTTPNWLEVEDYTEPMLGPERYLRQMPMGSMVRAGIPVTFSSDSIGGYDKWDAFYNMYYAVHRAFDDGELIMPPQNEGVTIEDAIRAYTINGAKQTRADKEIGSITEGKSADFVILTEDVLSVSSEKIKDIAVEKTFFRGNSIYERRDSK